MVHLLRTACDSRRYSTLLSNVRAKLIHGTIGTCNVSNAVRFTPNYFSKNNTVILCRFSLLNLCTLNIFGKVRIINSLFFIFGQIPTHKFQMSGDKPLHTKRTRSFSKIFMYLGKAAAALIT